MTKAPAPTDRRTKLYVGCSLTQAPAEFRAAVEALKTNLRDTYEVLDFVGLEKGTPTDVYHWDIQHCVSACDLLVGICDYPAIGLGYEMSVATEALHKPVLAVAQTNTQVSRLLLGIDAPGYSFVRYSQLQDVPALIAQKLKSEI